MEYNLDILQQILLFSADLNKIFQFLELFTHKLIVSRYNSDKP